MTKVIFRLLDFLAGTKNGGIPVFTKNKVRAIF